MSKCVVCEQDKDAFALFEPAMVCGPCFHTYYRASDEERAEYHRRSRALNPSWAERKLLAEVADWLDREADIEHAAGGEVGPAVLRLRARKLRTAGLAAPADAGERGEMSKAEIKPWRRDLWGVAFTPEDGSQPPLLLGKAWHETGWTEEYPGEPPRVLLFKSRQAARQWCWAQHRKYYGRQDCCAGWRFRPVHVCETVTVAP